MLFGEYSIILGSMGLTIPYAHFNGGLEFINKNQYTDLNFARRSNEQLSDYLKYLINLEKKRALPKGFDLARMTQEIESGLYFESSIPEGYGLGSSGALVASLYHRYVGITAQSVIKNDGQKIGALKTEMATLESYFHGTSSGIDPLICYLKHPLLLKDKNNITPIEIPRYELNSEDAIFLVNSGKPGKTAPLVKEFMQLCDNPSYLKKLDEEYIPMNNTCIQLLIDGNLDDFFAALGELSFFQALNFQRMIPANLESEWQFGLSTGEFILKLCGSGGGGFVLGFTRDFSEAKKRFVDKGLEIIPVYQTVKE
jgi:mevalonate kinase